MMDDDLVTFPMKLVHHKPPYSVYEEISYSVFRTGADDYFYAVYKDYEKLATFRIPADAKKFIEAHRAVGA